MFLHRRCHAPLSKKDDFIRNFKSGGNRSRKRKREGNEEDVGNAIFLWFEPKLGQGARLSGPLLKQKACELARTQGTDCTRSDGWLSGWKARHIVFKKAWGEVGCGPRTSLQLYSLLILQLKFNYII